MTYDFTGIAQGEVWRTQFTITDDNDTPVDLTGRTAAFVLRDKAEALLRAHLVSGGSSTGGQIEVAPAEGRVIVTVDREVTAVVKSAAWALWLDEATADADAVVWGTWKTVEVARSDA